jgi:hypothetical protein
MYFRISVDCLSLVCTPVTTVSDKAYQLLAHGRWFSPGTPVSSTNIDEILLKVPLNTKNQINQVRLYVCYIVWVRSGQEEYTEPIHLSEFKIVTVWFEGQHNDELYAYFWSSNLTLLAHSSSPDRTRTIITLMYK